MTIEMLWCLDFTSFSFFADRQMETHNLQQSFACSVPGSADINLNDFPWNWHCKNITLRNLNLFLQICPANLFAFLMQAKMNSCFDALIFIKTVYNLNYLISCFMEKQMVELSYQFEIRHHDSWMFILKQTYF